MGLLMCVDAVPAFHAKRKGAPSLMPVELVNLSLPPHLRYDPDNMICWMLIPANMSAEAQLKYFDYVVENELNPLFEQGVPGPDGPVRIKLFGASLDLKGKEKFYNQVTCFEYFHHFLNLFVHYFSLTICSLFFVDYLFTIYVLTGVRHGVLWV